MVLAHAKAGLSRLLVINVWRCSDHVGEERAGGLQVSALQAGEHLTQTLHL